MTATLRRAAAPPESLTASSISMIAVPQHDGGRSTGSTCSASRPTRSIDEAEPLSVELTDNSLCRERPNLSQQRTVFVMGCSAFSFALVVFFFGDLFSADNGGSKRSSGSDAALKAALSLTPIQTQVVHRHGDRTPITPMADESYWQTLLPSDETIDYISQKTKIIRLPNTKAHPADGGKTFGRLTQDGIHQMHQLGVKLRSDVERLMRYEDDGVGMKGLDHVDVSEWLRVSSTDFSRTLQSVQALLVGLLQESKDNEGNMGLLRGLGDGIPSKSPVPISRTKQSDIIEIDARHTAKMIPDPQPRRYVGQAELERELISSDMFADREEIMKPLAVRVTRALFDSGLLGDAASKVSFGVGEDETASGGDNRNKSESPMNLGSADSKISDGTRPLPWNQLAEILKCLERRNKLPITIKAEDLEAVAEHNAWRWFALLGDSRLAPMAIKSLAKKMILNGVEAIGSCKKGKDGVGGKRNRENVPLVHQSSLQSPPLLHIYSGHDATLIALMCAFRIERPTVWPEYGSYLKMELLRDDARLCKSSGFDGCHIIGENDVASEAHYYVLFSLNGEALRSSFGSRDSSSGRGQSRYFVPWEDALEGLKYHLEMGLPDLA